MKSLIFFYGICSFILLSLNLLVPKGLYIGGKSLIAINLAVYWLIFLPMFLFELIKYKKKKFFFILGISFCLIFGIIAILEETRKNDILPITYSLAFFCNTQLISDFYNDRKYGYFITRLFRFFLILFIIIAFSQAYGLIRNPFINENSFAFGSQRFTLTSESGLIPFIGIYLTHEALQIRNKKIKILFFIPVILSFLCMLAYGTRGILLGYLIAFLYVVKNELKLVHFSALFFIIISSLIIFPKVKDVTFGYLNVIENRNLKTGYLRLEEAQNDWKTFTSAPIAGAGFDRASELKNSSFEPSYGHIFLSGILARFGLLSFLLVAAYLIYFKQVLRNFRKVDIRKYRTVCGWFIVIIFMFLFGNPLYLFSAWPIIPFFFLIVNTENWKT